VPRPSDALTTDANPDHWPDLARRWSLVGPPLRVSAEDAAAYAEFARRILERPQPPRVLILGVTPELYGLPWPAGTLLRAADRSAAMARAVWPGPPEAVQIEDWTRLSFAPSSFDLALCDGGLHLLSYPDGQAGFVRSLRRVLAPGALLLLRLFVPPPEAEAVDEVLRDLGAGRIGNVNELKIRLDMALQPDPVTGVRIGDVWEAFERAEPDLDALAARTGWSRESLGSIEAYRGSEATYHFVTERQVRRLFEVDPGGFTVEAVREPAYELGQRFPLVALRRGPEDGG